MLVTFLTTAVGFILLGGVSRKTLILFLAAAAGVACAGLAAWFVGLAAQMGGFQMEEAEALLLQSPNGRIQVSGMLVAGILIASQGAVMDLAISIVSAVQEVHAADPTQDSSSLFRAGMRIGRDATGTMVNTLILAFVGSALGTLLLLYSYHISVMQLLNTDYVGVELIQGVASSIGIVFTLPTAAYLSARCLVRLKTNRL